MSVLKINGGARLDGRISVHGAKNSVLPIIAATIIHPGEMIIHNCPELSDVKIALDILKSLGAKVKREKDTVIIDASGINCCNIEDSLMREMRASVVFLGGILARCGHASIRYPGGCAIGSRPIDLHLSALRKLGVEINDCGGEIICDAQNLRGCDINLSFPSVGATENIMIAAVRAKGKTRIFNAAREPEIEDLQNFLCAIGAKVSGAGSSIIEIEGVEETHNAEHWVIPDRIAAATYLSAVAIAGGDVLIENVIHDHIEEICTRLGECGCLLQTGDNYIRIIRNGPLYPMSTIRTMPHPGFPTDAQAPFMALATQCDGTTIFVENIFENRFTHVPELMRMGADIRVEGKVAMVNGGKYLTGAPVKAYDLRGGAAMIVAALAAQGETVISNLCYIDRGYENIEGCLAKIGAQIVREV